MRFEMIKDHLAILATNEQSDIIMEALSVLALCGDDEIEAQLDYYIEKSDTDKTEFVFDIIENFIRPRFQSIFLEFGITIYKTQSISTLTKVLEGLLMLDMEEYRDTIRAFLHEDRSNEEILSRMIESITNLPAISSLECFIEVRSSLIDRLNTLDEDDTVTNEDIPDSQTRNDAVKRIKAYHDLTGYGQWIIEKIKGGYMCGLPFKYGLEFFNKELDEISTRSIKDGLYAVIGLYLSSHPIDSTMDEKIKNWVHEQSEDVLTSTTMMGLYQNIKTTLIKRLEHEQA